MSESGVHLQQDISMQNLCLTESRCFIALFQEKALFLLLFYGRNLVFADWNRDNFLQEM